METKAARSKNRIYITESAKETQRLAQHFAKKLSKRTVLALYGELGSGKTTFVQGLAQGLGITKRIISPTFIIIRSYKLTSNNVIPNSFRDLPQKKMLKQVQHDSKQTRIIHFHHIDLYRVESQRDLEGLGIEEILNDPQNIVAIEWAEKMGKLLPRNRADIKFEYVSDGDRKITIRSIRMYANEK